MRAVKRRTSQNEKTAVTEAVLFRDAEYGAAAVWSSPNGLTVVSHGFVSEDATAMVRVLSRYGATVTLIEGEPVEWQVGLDAHPFSVLSTLKQEMRLRGYGDDLLGERSISTVPLDEALRPDLPAAHGKVLVHEAVENGVKQMLQLVVAGLREHGPASVPSVRYFSRPNATPVKGKRPPFAVARFFIGEGGSVSDLREAVIAALEPWKAHLTKVSVVEAKGQRAVEVGLALSADVCEAFLEEAVPVFPNSELAGAREVVFTLSTPLSEEELADISDLGRACTGCIKLTQEGATLTAQVPGGFVGSYVADRALNERLGWLSGVLQPWGASVTAVGPLAEVNFEADAVTGALTEQPINEEEDAGYEVADHGLPPEVNTLLTQFATVKQHLWDTPPVKAAVKKAKELVSKKHGKDVADEFETKLTIARATACESVQVHEASMRDYLRMNPATKTIIDNPMKLDWAEDNQLTYALRMVSYGDVAGTRKAGAAQAGIKNELRKRGYSMRELAAMQDESIITEASKSMAALKKLLGDSGARFQDDAWGDSEVIISFKGKPASVSNIRAVLRRSGWRPVKHRNGFTKSDSWSDGKQVVLVSRSGTAAHGVRIEPVKARDYSIGESLDESTAKLKSLAKKAAKSDSWYTDQTLQRFVGSATNDAGWRQLQSWEQRDLEAELQRIITKGTEARPPHLKNYKPESISEAKQQSAQELVAIFDALKSKQRIYVAMSGVMVGGPLFSGRYNEWVVGRKSKSKRAGRESITLMRPGQTRASKNPGMNRVALNKWRSGNVVASIGDLGLTLIGIKLDMSESINEASPTSLLARLMAPRKSKEKESEPGLEWNNLRKVLEASLKKGRGMGSAPDLVVKRSGGRNIYVFVHKSGFGSETPDQKVGFAKYDGKRVHWRTDGARNDKWAKHLKRLFKMAASRLGASTKFESVNEAANPMEQAQAGREMLKAAGTFKPAVAGDDSDSDKPAASDKPKADSGGDDKPAKKSEPDKDDDKDDDKPDDKEKDDKEDKDTDDADAKKESVQYLFGPLTR